jgi:ribosomal protein S18 acetylase RimI-like enzyme
MAAPGLPSSSVPEPAIEIVREVTPELVEAMARLVPQLSRSAPAPTAEELAEIAGGDATTLLVARLDGCIVGSLTLVVFRIPTGVRAWIEDVVVDEAARGTGVGEALNRTALAEAQRRRSRTVDLTSRPSREAANRLYQRLGFVARETTVYRWG